MKLNLECGSDVIEGYINIDSNGDGKSVQKGDFRQLSVPDGSVDEIRASRLLRLVPIGDLGAIVQNWTNKLKQGGTLFIESPDSSVVGNTMAYDQITMEDVNALLYGAPGTAPSRGIYSATTLEGFLKQFGYKTASKGIMGHMFYIRAVKQ